MFCKKCGNSLPDNAKFCDKCGTHQIRPDVPCTSTNIQKSIVPESTASKRRKYIIIGIVGMIVLVLIAAAFFSVIQGANFFASQKSQETIDTTNGGVESSPSVPISTFDDDYTASYLWDGTLEEKFLYRVTNSDKFTMLYRNFYDPLVIKSISDPHIKFINMNGPDGTISYIKDSSGTVSFPDGVHDADISKIESLSQKNEVGIYKAGGFDPGIYPVVYNFKFYPPIEYDQSGVHVNIKLFNQNTHPSYERIKILVPEKSVREIYFRPSHLVVRKNNDMIVATGKLAKNEVLGFEVILEKDTLETLSGFPTYTENVLNKTEAAYPHQNPFVP
jgi:WD40 repeat protein